MQKSKKKIILLTQWGIIGEGLNNHGFFRHHVDNGSISRLDGLGGVLKLLTRPTVDLLHNFVEFAGDVSCVAIQHGGVTICNLSGVVQDDDLKFESLCAVRNGGKSH